MPRAKSAAAATSSTDKDADGIQFMAEAQDEYVNLCTRIMDQRANTEENVMLRMALKEYKELLASMKRDTIAEATTANTELCRIIVLRTKSEKNVETCKLSLDSAIEKVVQKHTETQPDIDIDYISKYIDRLEAAKSALASARKELEQLQQQHALAESRYKAVAKRYKADQTLAKLTSKINSNISFSKYSVEPVADSNDS
ncbi:hypothetical protein EV183_002651 [Coemansia sp. RSA 2336]|nr:hypothetical protein EV183_002651 [Coemansia sp. RSA 2336]